MTIKEPSRNESSQTERRATLENDRRDRVERIWQQATLENAVAEIEAELQQGDAKMAELEKKDEYLPAITEQLKRQIEAGKELDTGVVVAYALLEIANELEAIDLAITPNREGSTLHDGLNRVANVLERILDHLKRRVEGTELEGGRG